MRNATPATDALPPSSDGNHPIYSLFAGAAAGIASKTLTAPVERVKLLLQTRSSNVAASVEYGTTAWQVLEDVRRREGVRGFWRGNLPSVLQKGMNSAMSFLLVDWYKQVIDSAMITTQGLMPDASMESLIGSGSVGRSILSAGLAGGTTASVSYPLEFVRTRLAADIASSQNNQMFNGTLDVLRNVVQSDGWMGLYRGFGPSLAFVACHRALYLGGFDAAKNKILDVKQVSSLTMSDRVAVAQSVSMFAGTVCYPLDTVRRRLMMQAGISANGFAMVKDGNWLSCAERIGRCEGVTGFFRGLGPNLVKTVGGALLLVIYDSFRDNMG